MLLRCGVPPHPCLLHFRCTFQCRNALGRFEGLPGHGNNTVRCIPGVLRDALSLCLPEKVLVCGLGAIKNAKLVLLLLVVLLRASDEGHDVVTWAVSPAVLGIFNASLFKPLLCRRPLIAWSRPSRRTPSLVMGFT